MFLVIHILTSFAQPQESGFSLSWKFLLFEREVSTMSCVAYSKYCYSICKI